MSQTRWASRLRVVELGMGLLLAACSAASHRTPRAYGQSLDSESSACIRNPALCPPQLGRHSPSVAPAKPLPFSTAQSAALNIAAAGKVIQVAIDALLEARILEALSQCADDARSEILLKYFGGRGPTHAQCSEVVGMNDKGEPITRAMQLGIEQHQLALKCAQEKLDELKPGGFSISPRYHVDPSTGKVRYLSEAQVKELLNAGRSAELRGSIEPDIVIHAGNPLHVQAVIDFKFPCVNGGEPPWRRYPKGHAHHPRNQGEVYQEVLGVEPKRILPRLGVMR
jgi:hypothetical protein